MKRTKNKTKILFAGRYPETGIISGPGAAAKGIFDEHSKNSSSVFLQYFFDGRKYSVFKKLFGRTQEPDGRIITLGIFRLLPEVRRRRPEIIHLITFERFAVIFFIYRMLFKVKIVYNSHGIVKHENFSFKKLPACQRFKDAFCEKIFLKYSDKIIFPSAKALDIACEYYSFDANKSVILPNGVSDTFFMKSEERNQTRLIKAVMHYRNELNRSGIELLKKTPGTVDSPLEIYIITDENINILHTENLTLFIHKMMPTEELRKFYADKHVFLSVNEYDTFSIASAEAMASGLIPVVTLQTGISRYIVNGVNGFTFDYHDHNSLSGILNQLCNMPQEEKTRMSTAAKETAKELRWEIVFKMYEELYGETTA